MSDHGLKRNIGLVSATVIVVASMIGSGIFTTSGFIISEIGNPAVMLICWFTGGIFALTGALCYGELGAMLPRSGGEYAYLHHAFGPFPAFLSGWISLIVGFSAPIAAAAIAFATYILGPSGEPWFYLGGTESGIPVSSITALACGTVIMFSLIHGHSLKLGAGIQNILTFVKILFITFFIAAAFLMGKGDIANFSITLEGSTGSAADFAVALVFISFAYSGWNAAAYLGGEIKNPGRNLPLSLITGTVIVVIFYMLLNAVFIYALPPDKMTGTLEIGKDAAIALFGSSTGKVFGAAIAAGLLSVLSAMIMAGPRVYFAMARDGLLFKGIGAVKRKRQTPAGAIAFQALIAILMILVAAYDTLLVYIGFTLSLTAVLTVSAIFFLRRNLNDQNSEYRTTGYPLTPLLFICGNLWIVFYTVYSRPAVCVFGLLTIAVGGALYLFINKENKHESQLIENPMSEAVD